MGCRATDESHFRMNFSLEDRRSGKCDLESDEGMDAENNREAIQLTLHDIGVHDGYMV